MALYIFYRIKESCCNDDFFLYIFFGVCVKAHIKDLQIHVDNKGMALIELKNFRL